jgi:acetyltransferase-like isoleucine patch superfamily enzyme
VQFFNWSLRLVSFLEFFFKAIVWSIRPVWRLGSICARRYTRFCHYFSLSLRANGKVPITTQFDGPAFTTGIVRCFLGVHCRLGRHIYLETRENGMIRMGDRVRLNAGVHVVSYSCISIGDDTLIGEYTSIRDANHGMNPGTPYRRQPHRSAPILIGSNVWVGRGVAILAGVEIGDNAIIGANSVVTKSIPANCLAAGAPARVIREIPR